MKIKYLLVIVLSLTLIGIAADGTVRLAVSEPVNKNGIAAKDIEAIWGMLEATVDGGYELISRSALKSMLTEIGLTTSSNLLELNSTQRAELGKIKTLKYILVPTVSKLGTRLNMTILVLDTSTGQIDKERRCSETFDNLDELSDKLKDMLQEIGLGREMKKRGKSAILTPIVKVAGAPEYLREDFNIRLEEELLEGGVRLQNLKSVASILHRNRINNLSEVEPSMYIRIGELLRVDQLIQASINRFSCILKSEYINVTRTAVVRCIGNIDINIRVISAQTGEVIASIPFRQKIDFDDIDEDVEDWTGEDYGKYMIEIIMPKIAARVLPKVK